MILTRHARKRAHERLGLSPSAVARLGARARAQGFAIDDCAGELRAWMRGKLHRHPDARNLRVYGLTLFVFGELDALVTVMPVPRSLQKWIEVAKSKREAA